MDQAATALTDEGRDRERLLAAVRLWDEAETVFESEWQRYAPVVASAGSPHPALERLRELRTAADVAKDRAFDIVGEQLEDTPAAHDNTAG